MIPAGLVQQLEHCARLDGTDVASFAVVGTRDARLLLEAVELADVLLWMRRQARAQRLTMSHVRRALARPRRETIREFRRELRQRSKCQ